jgi:hypothetical protein
MGGSDAPAAAPMLLRGPHVFWNGGVWFGNDAADQPALFDERIGNLDLKDGQHFSGQYSKLTVRLDCERFSGSFEFNDADREAAKSISNTDGSFERAEPVHSQGPPKPAITRKRGK